MTFYKQDIRRQRRLNTGPWGDDERACTSDRRARPARFIAKGVTLATAPEGTSPPSNDRQHLDKLTAAQAFAHPFEDRRRQLLPRVQPRTALTPIEALGLVRQAVRRTAKPLPHR